jgi:hypothetical protein
MSTPAQMLIQQCIVLGRERARLNCSVDVGRTSKNLVTMATVTELKNGIWVIHWFTDATNGSTNIQCGQTALQLNSTFGNNQVILTLNEIQGKIFLTLLHSYCF